MQWLGIDLQRISLGALIIALGRPVDDAMTTIDVMASRPAQGDSKEHAAMLPDQTLAFPMLTGSFVTAAGFVPIGFARSAAGEYTFSIFAVVTIALIVSWFVAVLFAPLLGVMLLAKPKPGASVEPGAVVRIFRSLLVGAMRRPWVTIAATLGCFVIALLALPYVPRHFFPASDRPELVVDLALPANASIHATHRVAGQLDALLKDELHVARRSTYVGCGAIRFYLPLDVQLPREICLLRGSGGQRRRCAQTAASEARTPPGRANAGRRCRISPLELGPPGRLAGAVPGARSGYRAGALDRTARG